MKPEGERILGSRPHGGKDVSRTSFGIVYRVMGSNLAPEISMRPDTVPGLSAGSDSRPRSDSTLPACQHDGYAMTESQAYRHRIRLFVRAIMKKRKFLKTGQEPAVGHAKKRAALAFFKFGLGLRCPCKMVTKSPL